ncbi:MAG: hypothetical protein PUC12_17350, partial [Clostridiales bacterium]|nr:hypothetical protein [Clostridiales bacterium]
MENRQKRTLKKVQWIGRKRKMFKRILAVILTIAVLMSSLQVDNFAPIVRAESYTTLYLVDDTPEHWIGNDDAVIELVDNTFGHDRYIMTRMNGTTWSARVPVSTYNVTFNRYDSTKTTQWNSWSAGGRDDHDAYHALGHEYGYWDGSAVLEEGFHAGDVIYLDYYEFMDWEKSNAIFSVNFTSASKADNDGENIVLRNADRTKFAPVLLEDEIEEGVYKHIVSEEEEGAAELRFWRGNEDTLWNHSVLLTYSDYKEGNNCVKIQGWNDTGYVCPYVPRRHATRIDSMDIRVSGSLKVNRKIILHLDIEGETDRLDKENTEIMIIKEGGDQQDAVVFYDEDAAAWNHRELLFKEAGTYKITAVATDGTNEFPVTKTISIAEDVAPVADFNFAAISRTYVRDENGTAVVELADASVSEAGDTITKRIWELYYDANLDGNYTEDELVDTRKDNETEVQYSLQNVGTYKVKLSVQEHFDDTIESLINEAEYLSGDTDEKPEEGVVFEITNQAPSSSMSIQKSRTADIIFTVGNADGETLKQYAAETEKVQEYMEQQGIHAKVSTVSTSALTAQDTFAWKEYDHYNYKDGSSPALDRHIIYEGEDIVMLGYPCSAIKDFLYVEDNDSSRKVFEFDLQRDKTDWHSIEGGGFLFNTMVSDEENYIQGYCILVTQSGLKLIQIKKTDLKVFRNGKYDSIAYAGRLLRTFPMKNLYDEHHLKIVVDKNILTVYDGEKLLIDQYVLPDDGIEAYGYGPIISHDRHGCNQQSYFTFKNIVMQTIKGESLSDVVNGHDWTSGTNHYVINLSQTSVPELSDTDRMAEVAGALISNDAAFFGIGKNDAISQYSALTNTLDKKGSNFILKGAAGETEDEESADSVSVEEAVSRIEALIAADVKKGDYTIGDTLSTDEEVEYSNTYQDKDGDPAGSQEWTYVYDKSAFGEDNGNDEKETLVKEKPITIFKNPGAYEISLRVSDDPTKGNAALDSYIRWSDTHQYKKLILSQHRPVAKVEASVMQSKTDKTKCLVNVSYDAYDEDHPSDAKKGIRSEKFYYKEIHDMEWTKGKMPASVSFGTTYLVKYVVTDVEGTESRPAVCVVKSADARTYEQPDDTTPPKVSLSVSKTVAELGEEFYVEASATDDYGITEFHIYVNGQELASSFGKFAYTPEEAGECEITVEAKDIGENVGKASKTVSVVDNRDTTPPQITITSPKSGTITGAVDIIGSITDNEKIQSYTVTETRCVDGEETAEPVVLASGDKKVENAKIATVDTDGLVPGVYKIEITAEDTAGLSSVCSLMMTVEENDDALNLVLSKNMADAGETIQAYLTYPASASDVKLTAGGRNIAIQGRTAEITGTEAGELEVVLSAMVDGEEKSISSTVRFLDGADKTHPKADILSPEPESTVKVKTDICGTVSDEQGLSYYTLEYKMEGADSYTLICRGTEPVEEEVLGTLDTSLLENGRYVLRLTAVDNGGNCTRVEQGLNVEGNLKVGNMSIGFTDIDSNVSGVPLTVTRCYDSRNKESGDFGTGWRLALQSVSMKEASDITEGYEMVQTGSFFATRYQVVQNACHDVTIMYGDGTSDRFELKVSPERRALVPIYEVEVEFACVTNQKVKLELAGDHTAMLAGGSLIFEAEEMQDSRSYILTREDGTKMYLDEAHGLMKIEDTSGNTVKISKNGFTHSDGKGITFTRDEQGRIIKAQEKNDTVVSTITYAYDSRDDLISVTDDAGRTVSFTYDDNHNLIDIIDPSGIAVGRNEYDEEGRLVAVIDADGNRMEYEHDVDGRTEVVKDRLGNKTVYVYDDYGNVLSTTDANGNTTKSTYDSYGNVLTKTDAEGNVTGFTYDESGNLTTVTDANGNTLKNTYNADNQVTSMKTVDDTEILMDYDKNGNLSGTTDAEGNTTTYTNDKKGNVTGIADELGTVMTARYDGDGNVIETQDSAGNRTVNTYDGNGNRLTQTTYVVTEEGTEERTTTYVYNEADELVQTIDADGNVTSVERNASGKMTAAVDGKGRRTEYQYDSAGNVTKILYSDGTSELFEYDAEGRNTKTTSRTGLVTAYTYDKTGNLLKQTDARGNVTSYTYDKNYNVKTVTSPTGAVTTYTYDELNRNTSVTDSEGNVTSFTYNELSLQTSTTDAKGNVTRYEYDKNGNRTKVIYADGTYVETEYDERGRTVRQKDAAGRKTEYAYDNSDRLIQVEQNNGSVTTYSYDQTGNLTGITDANGNTTGYVYDADSRRIRTVLADGSESSFEYDSHGMLTASTDYNGVKTMYTYDKEDRLIRQKTGEQFLEYTYDTFGRVTDVTAGDSHITYRYNAYGELAEKAYENGQKITYTYDRYGRTSEIAVLQDDETQTSSKYEYDNMDRLTRVIAHNGTATVYTYDANGNRETAAFANGQVLTYSYDELNRLLLQKVVDKNGTIIAQYAYTLGKGGERTKVTETGACGNVETAYDYDKAGRLTKEVIEKDDVITTYLYEYDATGNRTAKTVDGEKTRYTYNSRNQLVTETGSETIAYSYDDNGNLLRKSGSGTLAEYTYDVYNRLIQYTAGSTTETYTYDAEGVRRSKTNSGGAVYFVSDTTGSLSQTLAETDADGNLAAAYTRADTLISQTRGDKTSYYLYDGHGDVRALINEEGRISDKYRYNAYGELLEQSGDTENHYLYTGEYYDGTSNLYYLRARYMNPSTGTFISMDTYEGSIYDPDTLHKYLYANGNPVKYNDPSGNFSAAVMAAGMAINDTITATYNVHLMGLLSGISNMTVN